MNKIVYPFLNKDELTFGVIAPSSGVEAQLKILMDEAKKT